MPSAHAGGALQQRGIQGFDGGVRRKLDGGAKGWDDLSLAGDDELQWPQGTLAPAGAHYSPGLPQELRMLVPASAAPERAPLSASALDGRPASPSTVEKMASMLRSLSFSAGRPLVGGDAAARGAQFLHVASTLQGELGAAHMQRLRERSPALARRLEGVLIASMATLLGAHAVEGAFGWCAGWVDELETLLPRERDSLFPGTCAARNSAAQFGARNSCAQFLRRAIFL